MMKKYFTYFCFVFLLILVSCKGGKKTTFPVRKDLTQAVYASGKLFPLNHYKVYSKFPGYVKAVHVKVGSLVKAGDPLLTIRNEQSEFSVETAKNTMELATKNSSPNSPLLQGLKNDMNAQRTKYDLDSVNYFRYASLLKQQAATQAQTDQAKSQFEISRQAWFRSIFNFQSTLERLKTEASNAELQYKTLLVNKNEYVILADQDGMVYDIDISLSDMVSLQKPLLEIGDADQFELELNIDETDIFLVRPGQKVAFTVDAYKDEVFTASVKEIYPRISQGNKTSKVLASIDLVKEKKFYSSLSAEANIVVSSKKNILVIPREFLIEGNKVKRKGSDELLVVKKGLEDIEFVEITEGINETTELILP